FELLELLDEPPLVIFSTAYDQYALQAFEKNATDYLLKPYSKERFQGAVQKALDKLKSGRTEKKEVSNILGTLEENPELIHRVAIKSRNKVSVVPVTEILYLEAEGDYVMIHTKDAHHLKEKTMKYFETHLDPAQFVRIHRSSIVNVECIARIELYDKESYMVHLKNGVHLKASVTGYKLLKQLLKM
ncbi:MAG TPA: LytTR family DNA-binding domain-containing protein, partial [Bacteroidales bacterium]|nr:LytTR family DNA-binding domain-containing protein [Bacteroidales bacterium]